MANTKAYYDGPADVIYRLVWGDNIHLGVPCNDACPHPEAMQHTNEIMAEIANLEAGARVLDLGCVVPAGAPVLAIGPAANWTGKQWPADRFAEVARRLTGSGGALAGARVAVLASGLERDQAQPVIDALPAERVLDLVGVVDLLTAAACLRRCRAFLGNDSGLMHLAAAAGIPTLGLFGPSHTRRYGPWGPHAAFLRTPESYDELVRRAVPPGQAQVTLMGGLPVEAVFEAAETLLARTG